MKKYTGKERTIYKIENYDTKLWFIKTHSNGVTYTNQTNGCGCFHPSMKGILYKLHDFGDKKKPNIFNRDWWYSLWNRGKDGYYTTNSRTLAEKELGIKYDNFNLLDLSKEDEIDKWILDHGLFISNSDMKFIFESFLKNIISPEFFDCEVIIPFQRTDKHGNQLHSSTEAWVHVRLFKRRPVTKEERELFPDYEKDYFVEFVEGVVTWENCD